MGYINCSAFCIRRRGRVAQSVVRLIEESDVPDSIFSRVLLKILYALLSIYEIQ